MAVEWKALIRNSAVTKDSLGLVLALCAIKTLSDNQDHPYRIPASAQWAEITKSGVSLNQRLREAFYEIEKANPQLSGVFTGIRPLRGCEEMAFRFIQSFGRMRWTRAEMKDQDPLTGTLAQEIDSLIDFFQSLNDYATPWGIAKLVTRIMELESGTVYDPAAGINRLLIEVAASSRDRSGIKLFGQEIDPCIWSIGQLNLILHGIYDATIWLGDTLAAPRSMLDDALTKFDWVVLDPPVNFMWNVAEADAYGRFLYGTPGKTSGDMAIVQHAISSLEENGKAVCAVSPGLLTRGGTLQQIRRNMIVDDLVEAVIALPKGMYQNMGISMCLLVVNKNKPSQRKKRVLLIDAENEAIEKLDGYKMLSKEALDRIINTYNSFSAVSGYSCLVSAEDIEDTEWRLAPSAYMVSNKVISLAGEVRVNSPTYLVHPDRYLNSDWPKKPLSEIARVFRGVSPSRESGKGTYTFKIVNLADIQDGGIVIDALSSVSFDDPKDAGKSELQPGDVLISCRGTALKIAVVPHSKEKMVMSQNFIGVRLYREYDPYFLKAFFETPLGVYFLRKNQRGTTMTVILPRDIEDMPIPDIPVDRQRQLVRRITHARQEFDMAVRAEIAKRDAEYQKVYDSIGLAGVFEQSIAENSGSG